MTRLLAATALAVALVGCSDEDDPITLPSPTAEASSPTPSAEPSASASPSDPFAVPDEITADYVERVLNEIQRLNAELDKEIMRRPVEDDATELPEEDVRRLEAIYAEPILTFNTRATLALLRSQEERDDLVPVENYGQLRMTVEEVLVEEPCIVARVDRDFSEVDAVEDVDRSNLAFAFLVRSPDSNPTGWQLSSLLVSDAAPGSADEEELRNFTANDLLEQAPEVCS